MSNSKIILYGVLFVLGSVLVGFVLPWLISFRGDAPVIIGFLIICGLIMAGIIKVNSLCYKYFNKRRDEK